MGETAHAKAMLERLLVIDFNPDVHAELMRRGIACRYGDVANMDTLHHAGAHDAKLVVSTIPDAILKGTDNLRLLKLARRLWPHAKVIVTGNRAASALALYEAGADFVFVSRLHSAAQMAAILEQALDDDFEQVRNEHIAQIRRRREVLA
jgi:voltage-gated potassium channel Kch